MSYSDLYEEIQQSAKRDRRIMRRLVIGLIVFGISVLILALYFLMSHLK